jgi:2-keto-3-deoxy-L-rhamnonate aldolase RhmA
MDHAGRSAIPPNGMKKGDTGAPPGHLQPASMADCGPTGDASVTTTTRPAPAAFRQRFAAAERLVGTFIKTPTVHAIEILGDLGFDFVVIDEEHAPFSRESIDIALLAAKASGTAGIVRVPDATPARILSVLDCGATGVLVPHVTTVEAAKSIVAASRYRGGRRGYSGSPRAGRYGATSVWANVEAADAQTTVIAMIEDPEAVENIEAIVRVDGMDGFFIGRGDLTVAFGAPSNTAPVIQAAVERITNAARAVGKPVCVMVNSAEEAEGFQRLGASAFIVSSDQGFMRRAAAQVLKEFAKPSA